MSKKKPGALDALQGTWEIVALEVEGSPMPANGARIVVTGDRFAESDMGGTYEGRLDVDERREPAAIDLRFTAGPEKGNTNRGIFEIGGDTWRLCLQMHGDKPRPERFASTPGSGLALETLARAPAGRAKAAPPSAPPREAPLKELLGEWTMTSCSIDGKALPAAHVAQGRRVAAGDEVTIYMGKQVLLKARYTIDRRREPHEIDYRFDNGTTQLGIFALEGDTLRVAFAPAGKPRPVDFGSRSGDGHTVTSWKPKKRG